LRGPPGGPPHRAAPAHFQRWYPLSMPARDCERGAEFNPICCPGEGGMMVPAIFLHDESEAKGGGFLEVDSFYGPAVMYFLAIVWAFTAVAIISDVFMTSIEVITSAEKELEVRR